MRYLQVPCLAAGAYLRGCPRGPSVGATAPQNVAATVPMLVGDA